MTNEQLQAKVDELEAKIIYIKHRIECIVDAAQDADYWHGLAKDELVVVEQLVELQKDIK